jgi:hypothetical protein
MLYMQTQEHQEARQVVMLGAERRAPQPARRSPAISFLLMRALRIAQHTGLLDAEI